MHSIIKPRQRGFSLLELLIGMAVLGTLMALGMPSYNNWQLKTRAKSASEFYLEAFRTARAEAVKHNAATRLVLIENATTGQYDWRVDLCFPSTGNDCTKTSTNWSSTTADAADVPGGGLPGVSYKSIARSAALLPKSTSLDIDLQPMGATSTYFTPTGWINTELGGNLNRIELAPVGSSTNFLKVAVALTVGGGASVCLPDLPAGTVDSRRCP